MTYFMSGPSFNFDQANLNNCDLEMAYLWVKTRTTLVKTSGDFICTFSLLIFLSIVLQTSKFRIQFTISSKYFNMACYLKWETCSGPISFEVQRYDIWTDKIQSFRCHSSSTTLGTRTGYWKPTRRGINETPLPWEEE